ncbi:developmental pluripotency-associated protein 3 [Lepus europaeus]|uniref:developmental pluripotency-associated protein 3 n=1 Tax=Lepus europaeus TaxID=9983 RepID=UPI002B47B290|nr:developmental pluripotency-associated protein 3 [Lepus europaeus]
MDSPENPDPTFSAGSFWISMGKNSQDSEMLTKNLSKLTLNASATKTSPAPEEPPRQSDRVVKMVIQKPQGRRGVRTMLSERRERLAKLRFLLKYQYSQVKQRRGDDPNEVKGESRSEPFRCCCSYCLAHGWDPSENARIEMDYDKQSI